MSVTKRAPIKTKFGQLLWDRGISSVELARRLRCGESTVRSWRSGRIPPRSARVLLSLSLKLSIKEINGLFNLKENE